VRDYVWIHPSTICNTKTEQKKIMTKVEDTWGGEVQRQNSVFVTDTINRRTEADKELGGDASAPKFPDENETFPDDFGKSLEILKERSTVFEAIPENRENRAARWKARAALDRIKAHVFNIQQSPAAPNTHDATDIARAEMSKRDAPSRRVARIAALRRARTPERLFAPEKITPTECPNPMAVSAREWLLSFETIRKHIASARYWAIDAELYELEHFEWIYPEAGQKELREEIASAGTDTELLAKLTQKLAMMKSAEGANTRSVFRSERSKKNADFEKSARVLIAATVDALKQMRAEAVVQENAWLDAFGLPPEPTALSRRYVTPLKEFQADRHPSKEWPLPWFGIKDIA
jgi:hypothetical protein